MKTKLKMLLLAALCGNAVAATSTNQVRIPVPGIRAGVIPTTPVPVEPIPGESGDGLLAGLNFPMTFNVQQVNTVGASRAFSLQNQGTKTLTIQSQTLSGDDANFRLNSDCVGKVLAPQASCAGTVEFHASGSAENKIARITVDHTGKGSTEFEVNGQAVLPSASVQAQLAFAPGLVGEARSGMVAVMNTGIGPLGLIPPALTGSPTFTMGTGNCAASLAPGASCEYAVNFTPVGVAQANGLLVVTTTAGTRNVPLSGSGLLGQLSLSVASVAIPKTILNDQGLSAQVTLSNPGNFAVSGLTLPAPTPFTLAESNCGSSLAAGASCSFKAALTPTVVKTYSGTMVVSAAQGLTVSLNMTGEGEAAPLPSAIVQPQLAFGPGPVGDARSGMVAVTNDGTIPLGLSAPVLQGSSAFTTGTGTCAASLAPGASCEYAVNFTPVGVAQADGTLVVNTTAGARNVALSGSGQLGQLSLSVASVAIPKTIVNNQGLSTRVTLSNSGNLAVSGLTLPVPTPFTLAESTCGTSIAVGASCSFKAALTPTVVKTYSGTMVVSAARGLTVSLNMTGEGEAAPLPSVSVQPQLAFGPGPVGESSSLMATVTNNGIVQLGLSAPALQGSSAFTMGTGNCAASLAPGDSCAYAVNFTPVGVAQADGTLVFNTTAGARNVALSGSGLLGQLNLSVASVAIPTTIVNNQGLSARVTLSNPGNYAVSGLNLPVPAPFTLTESTCGTSIAAGGSCSFKAALTPTAITTYSGTMVVSAARGLTVSLNITGEGKAPPPKFVASTAHVAFPDHFSRAMPQYERQIWFTNVGDATLTILDVPELSESDGFATWGTSYQPDGCYLGQSLAPQQQCSYAVKFWPQTPGYLEYSLVLKTSVGNATVLLSGTGL